MVTSLVNTPFPVNADASVFPRICTFFKVKYGASKLTVCSNTSCVCVGVGGAFCAAGAGATDVLCPQPAASRPVSSNEAQQLYLDVMGYADFTATSFFQWFCAFKINSTTSRTPPRPPSALVT